MNKKQIKDLALSNGFKLKEQPSGEMDLNPYVYDFADALLAKANERVKELEVQLKRLIDYEADQALLPEASSQGTRQLVNDIKNDATDVGGCYEVSCGLLDSLFEHYTDKGASKLLNKFAIEKKIEGAKALIYAFQLNASDQMKEWVEQLRKEQE